MIFDHRKFLDTPMFALDQLAIFSDIHGFIEFSEESIQRQKKIALMKIDEDVENSGVAEPDVFSYRQHLLNSIQFRFDVALPMRARYASLAALTSTIEWSMAIVKPSFEMPPKPNGVSGVVHTLRVFAERCGIDLDDELRRLEFLIWVRNSILHNAGTLKGYRHEQSIRESIADYRYGFTISNWHFIGETVEIKRGVLESLIEVWSENIRELYRIASERRLLLFS